MIYNTQHLYTHMNVSNQEMNNVPLSDVVSALTLKGAGIRFSNSRALSKVDYLQNYVQSQTQKDISADSYR